MSLLSHLLRSGCYCISGGGTRRGSLRVLEGLPSPQSNVVGDASRSSSSREGWRSSWLVGSRTAAVRSSGLCGSSLKHSPTVTAAAAVVEKKRREDRSPGEPLNDVEFFPSAAGRLGDAAAYVLGLGNIKASASLTYVPCASVGSRAAAGSAAAGSAAAASVSVSRTSAGTNSAATFSTATASAAASSASAAAVVGGEAASRRDGRWSSESFGGTEKRSPSFRAACAAMLLTLSLGSSSNSDSSNSWSSIPVRICCEGRRQKQSRRSASALLRRQEEEENGVPASRSGVIARRISPVQCCSSSAASLGHSTCVAPADASRLVTCFPPAVASLEESTKPSYPAKAASAAAASAAVSSVAAASNALVQLNSRAASTSDCLNAVSAAAAADRTAAAVAAGDLAANVPPSVAGPLLLFSDASVACGGPAGSIYAAAQPLSPAAVAALSAPAAAPPASRSAAAPATLAAQPALLTSTTSGGAADSMITPAAAAAATYPAAASSRGLYQQLTADSPLQLFSGAAHPELAREIAAHLNVSLGRVQLGRFLDGECLVRVLDEVRGRDVFVIQSVPAAGGDLHSSLVELFLLITTLRRSSAKRVTAVMPYFPYCRGTELKGQRNDICTPMAAADLAVLLQVCGADAAIFVDVHNPRIEGFFTLTGEPPIPMSNIDPHGLAVQYLQKKDLVKPVVVATDNTAGEKASSMWTLMKQYGINAGFTSMVCDAPKRQVREGAPILPPSFAAAGAASPPSSPRGASGVGRAAAGDSEQQQPHEHQLLPREQNAEELRRNWNLVGAVEGCDCVIVDDIIDTGEKAEATAKDLKAGGARRIFMFASHGILSKGAVDRINNSPIEEVVVTNTVPVPSHICCEKLVVLSVGKLLAEAIKRVHEDQSVSILCSSENNPRSS